jgi:glycosyltransferase involved in cell wall biosynthesis
MRTELTLFDPMPVHSTLLPRAPSKRQPDLAISAIITTHNEGQELLRTIRSVQQNTACLHELIVVDDGSSRDFAFTAESGVTLIRHEHRMGVAHSRHEATNLSSGNILIFLDAHQRVSANCLDLMAQVALSHHAIVSVDVCGFGLFSRRAYGACFQMCPKNGLFSAEWRHRRPHEKVSRIDSLKSPAYAIPSSLYQDVSWIDGLRGWGGSEAAVSLKAFFAGVDMLHLRGPLAKHCFRRKFPYQTSWEEVCRNHALIARVCFNDCTWFDYWLPQVFSEHLSPTALDELESEQVRSLHNEFAPRKRRADLEFWTELLRTSPPF